MGDTEALWSPSHFFLLQEIYRPAANDDHNQVRVYVLHITLPIYALYLIYMNYNFFTNELENNTSVSEGSFLDSFYLLSIKVKKPGLIQSSFLFVFVNDKTSGFDFEQRQNV